MPSCRRIHPGGQGRQRGSSLIEALIGLLVIAVGMLGSAQWQMRLRQSVDLARQQSEASRLAQQELENIRAFVTSQNMPGMPSFATVSSGSLSLAATGSSETSFRLERQVRDSHAPALKELELLVHWADRSGIDHRLRVSTALVGQAPVLVLPLRQRKLLVDAAPLLGRHAAIPRDSHDLGNGRSAFKPVTTGDEAWLFDNRSGRIVARCTGVPAGKPNRQLLASDLTNCSAVDLVLLSGRVRHSALLPPALPNASAARDLPPSMSIRLQLSSIGHAEAPRCLGEAVRMVDTGSPAASRPIAVAIDATPTGQGLAGWAELDDRFWRYHCAVALAPAGNGGSEAASWTGQLRIAADGWTLGSAAGEKHICRYSSDTDGSGLIDRPAETPDSHLGVTAALVEQNFLIIDSAQACPGALISSAAGGSLPWFDGNPATVPHQP